jgi:hypothetical protein
MLQLVSVSMQNYILANFNFSDHFPQEVDPNLCFAAIGGDVQTDGRSICVNVVISFHCVLDGSQFSLCVFFV